MKYFYNSHNCNIGKAFIRKTIFSLIFISGTFNAFAQPSISAFLPVAATKSDTVTINGSNFTDVLAVKFGSSPAASFIVINSMTIKAIVASGATGSVTVQTQAGTITAPGFIYNNPLPPTIGSFNPIIGRIGTTVTITGTNFSYNPAENEVYFGIAKATVTSATKTSLTVNVPLGASYQPITVATNNFTAYSIQPFLTTFSGGSTFLPSSFETKQDFSTGNYPFYFAIGDIDNDGLPDLVETNAIQNSVSVLRKTSIAIAFAPAGNFTTGINPQGVTLGDLDGDGKLDMAVANSNGGGSSVTFLRNTSTPGTVSFTDIQNYPTGNNAYSYPSTIAIKDLNDDGKPDLAIANGDGTVTIYRNTSIIGAISFSAKQNFGAGIGAAHIIAQDLDGDGKPDLAVANSSTNTISLLKNTSTPTAITFGPTVNIPASNGPFCIAAGDVDGDGKPDLAIANVNASTVSVFKNSSTIGVFSFNSPVDYPVGNSAYSVAIADLDGNGKLDLAICNKNSNSVSVLGNKCTPGNILFASKIDYGVGDNPYSIAIADLDNDSTPEIVVSNYISSTISVLRNTVKAPHISSFSPTFGGTGTSVNIYGYNFTEATFITFGGVAAASFTASSDTVITAILASGAKGNVQVKSPYGEGVASGFIFSVTPLINNISPTSGSIGTTVTITGANFNSTPENNIVNFGPVKAHVVSATSNELKVIVPAGAAYKPIVVTTGGLTAYSDKAFSVTFPGSPVVFLPGSFAARQDFSNPAPSSVCSSDLDGDGKPDLIETNIGNRTVSIFRSTSIPGAITFETQINLTTASSPSNVTTCDLDGDGKPEIVVANFASSSVSVFKNNSVPGTISFAEKLDFTTGKANCVAVGDLDGDGKPDIVTANLLFNGSFSALRNTSSSGIISFAAQTAYGLGGNPKGIFMGDLDKDGKPEVVVSSSSDDNVSLFQNTSIPGTISFSEKVNFNTGDGPYTGIEGGDLNNDGKPDLAIINYNGASVSVFTNTSTQQAISFITNQFLPVSGNPIDLSLGDIDGDGKTDIAVTGSYYQTDNVVSLLKNTSNEAITFAPKVDYTSANGPVDVCISDFDLDGKPDLAVVNATSYTVSIFRNKINEPVIVASGLSPVTGTITSRVSFDPTVQTHNGFPYVQRHYDIEPANNPATSTATITLYFSQQEFDNFNTHPAHGLSLPVNPTDDLGKANLRIYQYHGFSATSIPSSYSGDGTEIDPSDNKIIWNPTAQWWEVTFDIIGFSGFFAGSAGSSPLPLKLLSFSGNASGRTVSLLWVTGTQTNTAYFEIQRGVDGRNFTTIGKAQAAGNSAINLSYRYTDEPGAAPIYYYRLKLLDADGNFTYSNIISVKPGVKNDAITLFPNPANKFAIVNHPFSNRYAEIRIIDMMGKVVKTVKVVSNVSQTRLELEGIAAGSYKITWNDGVKKLAETLLIQ